MKTRVAVIAIIVDDNAASAAINRLLHEAADFVVGRMGIPYREKGIHIISVAVDAPQEVISALSGRIGRLTGVSVKTAYSGVVTETADD